MSSEYPEPAAYAEEAHLALRRLAHATRNIRNPDDVYPILGSLSSAMLSLRQSLDQLATWHMHNTERATTDRGSSWEAKLAAQHTAIELTLAAIHAKVVYTAVDSAHQFNGGIAWQPRPVRRLPPAPGVQDGSTPTHGFGQQIDQ